MKVNYEVIVVEKDKSNALFKCVNKFLLFMSLRFENNGKSTLKFMAFSLFASSMTFFFK